MRVLLRLFLCVVLDALASVELVLPASPVPERAVGLPGAWACQLRALLTGCLALLAGVAGGSPEVARVTAHSSSVGRFGRYVLDLDVKGAWTNPFDPAQADVSVRFTSPSGRESTVAAFYTRDYVPTIHPANDDRKTVRSVKFYTEEKGWHGASNIEFFFDDLELVDTRTGAETVLDDMESGDVRRWGGDGVSWSSAVVHGGRRSLRFAPKIDDVEHWPGPVMAPAAGDWSRYDGLVVWVYPRYTGTPGTLSLYFNDAGAGNSPIETLSVGSARLLPNRWNRVFWSWRDFPASVRHRESPAPPRWEVRFTPSEIGTYRYRVSARDTTGAVPGPAGSFSCRPSRSPGFVRISPKDSRYFVRDDGRPFFPIGHDVSWDLRWALRAFPRMAAHGEDATYCILIPWDTCIEWADLGRYDLERAAKVDTLLDLAAANGIYLKLSFDVHDALRRGAAWEGNPYSSQRGGPCKGPNDFYTDPTARELYKRRLRYMVARWGYATNVMAWETVAEADGGTEMPDGTAGWDYPHKPGGEKVSTMLCGWLREMLGYLRAQDPYGRLLTASLGGDVTDPQIWRMPEVQYVQLHHYDSLDLGQTMPQWCRQLGVYGKPLMVTEFGWWADWTKPIEDPGGICQHNGIWASALGGAAGSALSWWWERIDAQSLYRHYKALRAFVDGVDWPSEGFRPARAKATAPPSARYLPVTLVPHAPFEGSGKSRFAVGSDIVAASAAPMPQFLLASDRRHEPPLCLVVDCPVAGEMRVRVDTVCPDARLDIRVDGDLMVSRQLPCRDVPGKASTYDEKWKVWRCRYDEDVAVALKPGRHEIWIENGERNGSWIWVTAYTLTRYAPPKLRVVGVAGRRTTMLWIQSTESTWRNAQQGLKPGPSAGALLRVEGLAAGRYAVEWWDTYAGRVTSRREVPASGRVLALRVPPFVRDLACKLRHLGTRP